MPLGFFRLVALMVGSKFLPLMSHSISPPALPRWTSKIMRSFIMLCQFDGIGGISHIRPVGMRLWSGTAGRSPMTIFIIGTL